MYAPRQEVSPLKNTCRFVVSPLFLFLMLAALVACGPTDGTAPETAAPDSTAGAEAPALTPEEEAELRARAVELAKETIITDTHIDVPYRLHDKMEDISVATEGGHFDYPRAVAGGLDAPFMSIYVPAELQEGGAKEHADHLIDMVEKIAADSPDKFAIATSPDDLEAQKAKGLISLPMGMENGAPIEGDLENLRYFYDRGIRYITLTHGKVNHISDSSYDAERKWNGLSDFGLEVVAEMNRLGIMVDISHVSDDAFWKVMEISQAPAIASHSSVRKFTPGWERNIEDEMIKKLAENGGVVSINFGSSFLTEEAQKTSTAVWRALARFTRENGITDRSDPRVEEFRKKYVEENPPATTSVHDVVDHIDHVVQLVGIDYVGLGSDYDGVTALPEDLGDVSTYPTLIYELLKKGYSEDDIRKICSGNVLRVWREVEEVAKRLQEAA